MRILSRYLLKQHLAPFLFALGALTGFQLLNQIARRFGDLVGKGLPGSVIAEVFALSIPFIVTTTLSMAVLVAVLYAVGRLTAEHELTAIRASGVSVGRLMTPLLGTAVLVAGVAFLFSDQVLPRSNHRLRTLLVDIGRKKPTFALKEQAINEVQRNRLFLRAARIDQSTFGLRDVTIYDLSDQQRKRLIRADSGYMALTENQEDLHLTLYDGTMHELDRTDLKVFQQVEFRRNTIRVQGIGNELRRTERDTYKGDREMGVCEMENVIRTAEREREITTRRMRTARLNGLRAVVGLETVQPDTVLAPAPLSRYCRALQRFGGFLLPAELRAEREGGTAGRRDGEGEGGGGVAQRAGVQERPRPPSAADTTVRLLDRLSEPGRRPLTTSAIPTRELADVRPLQDRARSSAIRAANYRVELHKKYAIAAACIVFVLVGVPLAISFPQGGVGFVVGASLAIFSVYYVGLIGGESLGNRLIIPAFWAMWTPNVLFAALGLIGLWSVRRHGTRSHLPRIPLTVPRLLRRWFPSLGARSAP